MKKCWMIGLLCILLTGCAGEETFETIADELLSPVMASPAEVAVWLPEEMEVSALTGEEQRFYMGEDYEVFLENRPSGDLEKTIRYLSGFERDALTVVKTSQGNLDRYEFVWTCMGEQGQRLGRAVILDDGSYHYCLSVLRDADAEPNTVPWRQVFASFGLV